MCEKQRENSPDAAHAQVANAGTNAQKQLKRELDFWTWGGIPSHDISPANLRLLLINAEVCNTPKQ